MRKSFCPLPQISGGTCYFNKKMARIFLFHGIYLNIVLLSFLIFIRNFFAFCLHSTKKNIYLRCKILLTGILHTTVGSIALESAPRKERAECIQMGTRIQRGFSHRIQVCAEPESVWRKSALFVFYRHLRKPSQSKTDELLTLSYTKYVVCYNHCSAIFQYGDFCG